METSSAEEKENHSLLPVSEEKPLEGQHRGKRNIWEGLGIGALLLVLLLQLLLSARQISTTMDEQNHIARGLAYLRTGETRLNRIHPPLVDAITALPLALDKGINLPLDSPAWQNRNWDAFAEEFLWVRNENGPSIVARARLPVIILTLLLGLTCYAWGRELYGAYAGIATLILLTFDPNILAHGRLATNDLGMAFFSTLSLYTFWRFLRKPGWSRINIAGVAMGLALVAKFSALFLLPSLALIAVLDYFGQPIEKRNRKYIVRAVRYFGVMLFVAAFVVWAVYGFQFGHSNFIGISLPAPDYLNGIGTITARVERGGPAFLMGEFSQKGWWYYFPLVFVIKTPLPSLLLISASFAFTIWRRAWLEAVAILIPVAIYFGASLTSSLNIGYRHLLPVLPLLFVFAGQLVSRKESKISDSPASINDARTGLRRKANLGKWQMALVTLFLWLIAETSLIFPDYLPYFNELIVGSGNRYKVLADSNLDWGQGLIQLRHYMDKTGIPSVKLSYFGSAHPEKYDITYEPLPDYPRGVLMAGSVDRLLQNPPPGVYAISVTSLQGLFFPNPDLYAWFRDRKPDAVIGHTIFIYNVQ